MSAEPTGDAEATASEQPILPARALAVGSGASAEPTGDTAEPVYRSVEELLEASRAGLHRLDPAEVAAELAGGARLVDIRPAWQRAVEGEIPGALVLERNHLEWRLHPGSAARVSAAVPGQRWIVLCSEGYTSSLAAASLRLLGVDATDLAGGIRRWQAEGLPVRPGTTRVGQVVGQQPSVDFVDLAGPHVIDEAAH